MVNVPIRDIPGTEGTPNAASLLAMDNGISMQRTTVKKVVDAGAPVATQSEAELGANNDKRMTSLRVKQSIASEIGSTLATKEQGDLANSALQPSAIGTSVQGFSAKLLALASQTWAADQLTYQTGASALSTTALTPFARTLLDDVDAAAMRSTMGLAALAVKATVNNGDWFGLDLSIENGGTGASTADVARTNLGAASAAQGVLADTAVQPGDLGSLATKNAISVPSDINATGTPSATSVLFGDGTWKTLAGGGDMLKVTYDPTNVGADTFNLINHDMMTLPEANI